MKKATAAELVAHANHLRDVVNEKNAESNRYWNRLKELSQAEKNAGSPQELWDAYRARCAHYNSNPPSCGDVTDEWVRARRIAMKALADEAGLLETVDE